MSSLRSYAAGKGPQDEIIAEKTDGLLSNPPSSEGLRIHPLPQGQEGASLPVVAPAHLLFMRGQSHHSGPSQLPRSFTYLHNGTDLLSFPSILDWTATLPGKSSVAGTLPLLLLGKEKWGAGS